MSAFNQIVDKIKLDLSQSAELSGIKFISLDNEERVPNPIKSNYVSLGIEKISIKEGALNSFLGTDISGEQYGNKIEIIIEMSIFSPRKDGSKECYETFSKIYEELLRHRENYNIEEILCGKTKYNTDVFSFELNCSIKLSAYLGYETEEINISDIKIEKKS